LGKKGENQKLEGFNEEKRMIRGFVKGGPIKRGLSVEGQATRAQIAKGHWRGIEKWWGGGGGPHCPYARGFLEELERETKEAGKIIGRKTHL